MDKKILEKYPNVKNHTDYQKLLKMLNYEKIANVLGYISLVLGMLDWIVFAFSGSIPPAGICSGIATVTLCIFAGFKYNIDEECFNNTLKSLTLVSLNNNLNLLTEHYLK